MLNDEFTKKLHLNNTEPMTMTTTTGGETTTTGGETTTTGGETTTTGEVATATSSELLSAVPIQSKMNDWKSYLKIEKLGRGAYGVVFKTNHIESNGLYAIKKFTSEPDDGMPASTLREIACLKSCDHPNVVKIIDIIYSLERPAIVMPCYKMDLKSYIQSISNQNTEIVCRDIMWNILKGVSYLHSLGFMHRDIKPQNILVDYDREFKYQLAIADLGLCTKYCINDKNEKTAEICTLWYRPPEILLGLRTYSTYIDVWSIGCVFAEILLNGKPILPGDCEIDQMYKIFQMLGTPSSDSELSRLKNYVETFPRWESKFDKKFELLSGNCFDLLKKLLNMNYSKRISCNDAMDHPFFNDLKPKAVEQNLIGEKELNSIGEYDLNCGGVSAGAGAGVKGDLINSKHFERIELHFNNDITAKMRIILMDWLIEVYDEYHLKFESYFLGVSICDRYLLKKPNISRSKLQLLGITALSIASKLEEIYPPSISDYLYISDNTYSATQMCEMEIDILQTLEFNLYQTTVISALNQKCTNLGPSKSPNYYKVLFYMYYASAYDCNLWNKWSPYDLMESAFELCSMETRDQNDVDTRNDDFVHSNEECFLELQSLVKISPKERDVKINGLIGLFSKSKYYKIIDVLY
jgi:serine/threonine protein kinase